ncbi:ThuA domain-containing protein [Bremerella sp. JC770]|uniref:ThuA domain-containing protein n=1 Tax=Bremerella sp. JC770 TaxID=3232137 RepID=UPI00345AC682
MFRHAVLMFVLGVVTCLWGSSEVRAADEGRSNDQARKIVLVAGKKSHGPLGNGIHDYPWSVKLLKVMFDNSNVANQVRVEYHLDGWPKDPSTFDDADTIVVISDGRDGEKFEEAPHFQSPENTAVVQKQIDRGCGFVTFHFSTFAADENARQILDWSGAYFDWEENGMRKWYSAIQTQTAAMKLSTPDHPISRGVKPFTLREEFYFNLRFQVDDPQLLPVANVPTLPGRDEGGTIVAWAKQRENGGRGFGTTCGHFYENWKNDDFRKLVMNGIAWSAQVDIPADGVAASFFDHGQIDTALAHVKGTAQAKIDSRPIRALILTGAHHPGHAWQDTTPVLEQTLLHDPRAKVTISRDIEDLATIKPSDYDLLVLNYCNWKQPGLSDAAKMNFVSYLEAGGGLIIIHFANGAFHRSLPNEENTDWSEYRKICRRVWDHAATSGHDRFGQFTVNMAKVPHPITEGLSDFQTTDELYFRQSGELPIEVLATAKSNVTGNDEPMAFVYRYGNARVFQTVLGHAADSLRTPGTAEMIRRAAAWVADRPQVAVDLPKKQPKEAPPKVPARFGQTLPGPGGVFVDGKSEYRTPPLTVECWARLDSKKQFNILIANESKASASHWELFTRSGSGHLAAYLPGMKPDHVMSTFDLCDGKWHYVAMQFEPTRIRLSVDGKQVADQVVAFQGGEKKSEPLAIGTLVSKSLGHDGAIDEVRISKGIRDVSSVPEAPFQADDTTLGLWHLDEKPGAQSYPDASQLKNHAKLTAKESPPAKKKEPNHFGKEVVGFDWTESDSVDSRWNEMEIGRFLASTIPLPEMQPVRKALSISVGEGEKAHVVYDTQTASLRAGWSGDFLKFNPARFGLISSPAMAGKIEFVSAETRGWLQPVAWQGHYQHDDSIVLSYRVGQRQVLEVPSLEGADVFGRTLLVSSGGGDVTMNVGRFGKDVEVRTIQGTPTAIATSGDRLVVVSVQGASRSQLSVSSQGTIQLAIPAAREDQLVKVLVQSGEKNEMPAFEKAIASSSPPQDIAPLTRPGKARWTDTIVTTGQLGEEPGPYALDTITIPFDNPYRALMFVGGHDFFANGDLAVCTVHGDVWRVSGVDQSLESLHWKRMATGLFQPLGLRIVDDIVHVLGRDQITKLHDTNQDGEADYYENFCNLYQTSPGGHDYVTCLETDPDGNFYLIHATQGVVRISRDGSQMEVVASGLRNPNGLAVGPQGTITASPQEGTWTPASCVVHVTPGGYYGFGGPKVTSDRPLGYDSPLCWIPRLRDNSSGGQVWVTSDDWGPLQDQLIHFSYGKCRMMLVPTETIAGQMQGGTVEFPLDFDSGAMRGGFSPHDGQLYVSGLNGWVTAAQKDGCLQRVRYTGRPVTMPVEVQTLQNGIAITFSGPLDRQAAEDPGSYSLSQWNYRYSSQYGSLDYRVSDPRQEGHDMVEVLSATLLEDGQTVFLELAEVQPVDQLSIEYALSSEQGQPLRQTLAYTIHHVRSDRIDESRITRQRNPGKLDPEIQANLRQGLLYQFQQGTQHDARNARMAALFVPAGQAPTPFLKPGSFTASATGYLNVPLKGSYQFRLEGNGAAQLLLNGHPVTSLDQPDGAQASLHKGYNRLEVHYQAPSSGNACFRLRWAGEQFADEPVPPEILWSDARDHGLTRGELLREGRSLVATHQCFACHAPSDAIDIANFAMPELKMRAPDLTESVGRLGEDWVARWVLDPHAMRDSATMPKLLDPKNPDDRQTAADLAAFLAGGVKPSRLPVDDEKLEHGELLFEDLGCIACHRLTDPTEEDEFARLSLLDVMHKLPGDRLHQFLRNPGKHHATTRMPDFRLSEEEAASLTAYLLSQEPRELPEVHLPEGDAKRGKEAFKRLNCVQCHANEKFPTEHLARTPIGQVDRGCLGEPGRHVPQYDFTARQTDALRAFLATDQSSLTQVSTAEASRRLMDTLNCTACHARDGQQSPRGLIILEEGFRGLAPESLPNLTWAGDKLYHDWTEQLLAGQFKHPTRQWLKARMPAFPAFATTISEGLAAEHGHATDETASHRFDTKLANIGNQLTQKETLDCRQCHAVGQEMPRGDENTKIALGINFTHIRQRLRPDFYHRFVLDPPRYDLMTKMPKLSADGKTTKVDGIYDGNAARQFESLWHFIQSTESQ